MQKISALAIASFFYILALPFSVTPTFAQNSGNCSPSGSSLPAISGGLVSTPDLTNNLANGVCIIDPRAAFAPYKIPTYDDLKSLYYTQAKSPIRKATIAASPSQGAFTSTFTQNDIVLVNGDLPDLNYTGTTKPSIIFVESNLSISNNITYGDDNSGIVFIVRGNVNIDKTVTRIDAVIISGGIIYTALTAGITSCSSLTPVTASQLVINGSLISLGNSSIKFCRSLTDNSQPAEKINHQVKYLVILRNILSDTYQKWSEVTGDITISPPPPPPAILPSSEPVNIPVPQGFFWQRFF